MNRNLSAFLFLLLTSIIGGLIIALLSAGSFITSLFSSSLLLLISLSVLYVLWKWAGQEKILMIMIIIGFFIRLVLGISLMELLPVFGHDQEVQNAGYLYRDAFERDTAAWNLAKSDAPLWTSFTNEIKADQYGGMLSISAFIYRTISSDAHRPELILILGAFIFSTGIIFLYKGLQSKWGQKIALWASWIYILYPDGVFFSSSQMREPFLFGMGCVAFWAVLTWQSKPETTNQQNSGNVFSRNRSQIIAFIISVVIMFPISSRIAVAIITFLLIWFSIQHILPFLENKKWIFWAGLLVLFLAGILIFGDWMLQVANWDFLVSETQSGWIQKIVEEGGERIRVPFLTVMGLTQPLLPAALVEPSVWIWKSIAILRSTGWYLFLPVLVYGIFAIFTSKDKNKTLLGYLAVFLIFWFIASSYRAGGDIWDNPRYRAGFLPWIALFAAWAVNYAQEKKDGWLITWFLVVGSAVLLFTNWYLTRYVHFGLPLSLYPTIAAIILSAAILLGGKFILDKRKKKA